MNLGLALSIPMVFCWWVQRLVCDASSPEVVGFESEEWAMIPVVDRLCWFVVPSLVV